MEVVKAAEKLSASSGVATRVTRGVTEILQRVLCDGDRAILDYSKRFDNWSPQSFQLQQAEVDALVASVPSDVIADIRFAQSQIRRFAQAQRLALCEIEVETQPGITLGHRNIPVASAACYVPGGRYPIVASAHMGIVTRKWQGCGALRASCFSERFHFPCKGGNWRHHVAIGRAKEG